MWDSPGNAGHRIELRGECSVRRLDREAGGCSPSRLPGARSSGPPSLSKVAFAKLYERKTPICSAELLNDRVIPFFDGRDVGLLRILTDRGTEYCGNPERHEHEAYLAVGNIDHSRTRTKRARTNGIAQIAAAMGSGGP